MASPKRSALALACDSGTCRMRFGAALASMFGVSMRTKLVATVAVAVAVFAVRTADAMTLDEAIAEGARRGPPAVESARAQGAARDFARDPGSSLPKPVDVTIMAGARKPYNLPVGPEVVVTATQEISSRGLGSARRNAAEWSARIADSDVERSRIEGALHAALAWIDLLEAQQLLSARHAATVDAEKVARLAEIRVTSGVATATERSLASAEVGGAKLAILEAEGRATEARFALALAVGAPLDSVLQADGTIEPANEPAISAQRVLENARRHPALIGAAARSSFALAEVDVARATNGPFFAVGASVWREGSGDHAAAAVLTFPLPFFDPAKHETGRLGVQAATASANAERLRGEIERDARIGLHEREHTREVRVQLRDGVVAPLRRALETAIASYTAGTADLGVVLLARRSALAAEERLVVANADVARADLRVAAIAGTLVRTGATR